MADVVDELRDFFGISSKRNGTTMLQAYEISRLRYKSLNQ